MSRLVGVTELAACAPGPPVPAAFRWVQSWTPDPSPSFAPLTAPLSSGLWAQAPDMSLSPSLVELPPQGRRLASSLGPSQQLRAQSRVRPPRPPQPLALDRKLKVPVLPCPAPWDSF